MFASHRSTRLVAGLFVSAAALFGAIAPHAHAAAGMTTVTDPTRVYQISYPTGWTANAGQSGFVLYSQDGNLAVMCMDWTGSSTNSPLVNNLPTLPGAFKLGTETGAGAVATAKIGGRTVQYGMVGFIRSDGGNGAAMAVRAYDKGHVIYLIGVVKDSSAYTAKDDTNQLVKVLYTTRFL